MCANQSSKLLLDRDFPFLPQLIGKICFIRSSDEPGVFVRWLMNHCSELSGAVMCKSGLL